MPIVDLEQHVAKLTRERRCREFETAERAAEARDCPPHWRSAFQRYQAEFLRHLQRREFVLPIEFHGHGSTDDGYRALKVALSGLGKLIASWPELWNASLKLRRRRSNA